VEFEEKIKLILKELEDRLRESRQVHFCGQLILEINMNQGGITRIYETVRREI